MNSTLQLPVRRAILPLMMFLLSGCVGIEQTMPPPPTQIIEATPARTLTNEGSALAEPSPEASPAPTSVQNTPETGASQPPQLSPTPVPLPAPTETPPAERVPVLTPWLHAETPITYLAHAGDNSGRLFLVEKGGRIRIVEDGKIAAQPFLDLAELVESGGSEQGLLSVAFDPNYAENGEFYVNYTGRSSGGGTVVARYRVGANPALADPFSAQVILEIAQPARNHNGGQLQFGPDGYLYVGMGDGGAAGDPWDNGENLNALLGKMLRLDVRGQATYAIPTDNPFRDSSGARPEIWAYGLRNPWRFSFDRQTGDLYIADVGQNAWEEVNHQAAGAQGGQNYGWNTMEGLTCYQSQSCEMAGKVMPVATYSHEQGCSITGGYVYRGQALPQLTGAYLYADFCSGTIWELRPDGDDGWQSRPLLESGANIASFGEDEQGELYLLDLGGQVFRLEAAEVLAAD